VAVVNGAEAIQDAKGPDLFHYSRRANFPNTGALNPAGLTTTSLIKLPNKDNECANSVGHTIRPFRQTVLPHPVSSFFSVEL
jgi:hypothetical protein